jgi:hypothetical protein
MNPTSHSSLLAVVMISTQNSVVNKGHVEVYHTLVDELLLFHQLKRNFNHFDKFYLKEQKFPRFSMHECNAHICFLSISSLTSWNVTTDRLRGPTGVSSASLAMAMAPPLALRDGALPPPICHPPPPILLLTCQVRAEVKTLTRGIWLAMTTTRW